MPEIKLAANMRSLRDVYGYSQDYVSSRIHVARQTYSNYERGKKLPDIPTLLSLAELYQVTLDQLLFGDFSGVHSSDDVIREHMAMAPDDSLIRLNGADAKMLMDYKSFPSREQKEVREFVRFKKYLFTRENPAQPS